MGWRIGLSQKVWIPCELHTHTIHSDATHTLRELTKSAVDLGFEAIALTDHNTTSGHVEVERVRSELELEVLPGLEWTTFHGHMLVLGTLEYVDWRNIEKADIHRGIEKIHERGGIAGLAHPFRVGSPMCTGCHWEYEVDDWNDVDFIEVWSGVLPSVKLDNRQAFRLWTDCLNDGYIVSATSGRDWHNSDPVSEPICATYIGVNEQCGRASLSDSLMEGLRNGVITVSMGPRLNFAVDTGGQTWEVGDHVRRSASDGNTIRIDVEVDYSARAGHWSIPDQQLTVVIDSNLGCVAEVQIGRDERAKNATADAEKLRWLRAELYGVIHGVRTMIGFTNPIYFSN